VSLTGDDGANGINGFVLRDMAEGHKPAARSLGRYTEQEQNRSDPLDFLLPRSAKTLAYSPPERSIHDEPPEPTGSGRWVRHSLAAVEATRLQAAGRHVIHHPIFGWQALHRPVRQFP